MVCVSYIIANALHNGDNKDDDDDDDDDNNNNNNNNNSLPIILGIGFRKQARMSNEQYC
jgi:hypothetical protein